MFRLEQGFKDSNASLIHILQYCCLLLVSVVFGSAVQLCWRFGYYSHYGIWYQLPLHVDFFFLESWLSSISFSIVGAQLYKCESYPIRSNLLLFLKQVDLSSVFQGFY